MSRSNYSDDCENWQFITGRGMITSATRGKRGQEFLRALLEALDAMPEKVLIAEDLENSEGVCAIGSLGKARGMDLSKLDPEVPEQVAAAFNIAPCLAQEVVYMNDDYDQRETPQQRWVRMRAWVARQVAGKEQAR